MRADQLILSLGWAIWLSLCLHILLRLSRRPTPIYGDALLLFGAMAVLNTLEIGAAAGALVAEPLLGPSATVPLLGLAFAHMRLTRSLAGGSQRFELAGGIGLVLLVIVGALMGARLPPALAYITLIIPALTATYGAFVFLEQARLWNSVTGRRIRAGAAGSTLVALYLLLHGVDALNQSWQVSLLAQLCGLAAGLAYVLGFAPPVWLRRAWQEPELQAFLGHTVDLLRQPSIGAVVAELERGVVRALGVAGARIVLRGDQAPGPEWAPAPAHLPTPIIAVPIAVSQRSLGMLVITLPRAPVFVDEDLALAQLLADQAAIVLDYRTLIEDAARARARAEAIRLKSDFLEAAVDELEGPLARLIRRAQQLERQARHQPQAPLDGGGVYEIVSDSYLLRRLVGNLLDGARATGQPDEGAHDDALGRTG